MTSMLPAGPTDLLERRLAAAENAVRRYCGWHIAPVIDDELVLDGSGTRTLFVPSLRVDSILSCEVGGVPVDVETLEWSGDGYLRRSCGVWPDRLRAVKLSIRHGFESAPEVVEIVHEMAERAMSAVGGRVRETAGGVSIANATTAPGVSGGVVLMEHERVQLEPYRIHRGT